MEKNLPLVTIIIAAYNKAELTVKTVESVLNQTYSRIEIIVVDDGSTDDTASRLLEFKDKIRYLRKENGGACSARNVGIKSASEKYIGLLDCDDIYYPEKVALSVGLLEANPDYGFVHTAAHFIDNDAKVISSHHVPEHLRQPEMAKLLLPDNFICNSTMLIRKDCFDRVGLFDETIFMPADWDMWVRLAREYKGGYIDVPLTGYRLSASYTMANLEQGEKEDFLVLQRFLTQKPELNLFERNKIIARTYIRFGKRRGAKGDLEKARDWFLKAIVKNPFNGKLLLFMPWSFLFPKKAQTLLADKVLLRR